MYAQMKFKADWVKCMYVMNALRTTLTKQAKRERLTLSNRMIAVYIPNDGSENVCIAKYDPDARNRIEKNVNYESTIVLPRLALGYYFSIAAAVLVILGTIWLFVRKKAKLRVWVERIGMYPAAYMISHCIVSGIDWSSCSLPRDFSLIIILSVLLYSGMLLTHSIWRLKKEIKEINR